MKPAFILATLAASLLAIGPVRSAVTQPHAAGIETYGYQWNAYEPELQKALAYKADAKKGQAAYRVCKGCHKADGAGVPDAGYPQLAGQHASVIIKQMVDIRTGRRDNPRMYPFAGEWLVSVNDIADIAAYLNKLQPTPDNRKGDGSNLAHGKALYDKDCASCHGETGTGDAKKFYPMVAHQHYDYLVRQTRESRDMGRRNANPEMVAALKSYSDADIDAVSDYMSRLAATKRK